MLESKGGPIQLCCIHDVTRLHGNDVVVGDSCGMVTVFCNGQILHRKSVSQHCLQCLQVQQDGGMTCTFYMFSHYLTEPMLSQFWVSNSETVSAQCHICYSSKHIYNV